MVLESVTPLPTEAVPPSVNANPVRLLLRLTPLTRRLIWRLLLLKAVLPPAVVTLAVVPVLPLLTSQARMLRLLISVLTAAVFGR